MIILLVSRKVLCHGFYGRESYGRQTLVSLTSQGSDRVWKAVMKALGPCWRIHQKGVVDKKALVEALQRVKDNVPVIVHGLKQNGLYQP